MKTAAIPLPEAACGSSLSAASQPDRPHGFPIKNVLIPTDFSPASLAMIEYAHPLLRHFHPKVHLVHAFETESPLASLAAIPLALSDEDVRHEVDRHLREVADKHQLSSAPTQLHAVKGVPFAEICRVARETSADLMITSTRGNTGLKYLALGSTADLIVRYSPCPVLVVPSAVVERSAALGSRSKPGEFRLRRILVPIDFSDCSMHGLEYARRLAKETGAKLVLLNSIAMQYYMSGDEFGRYDLSMLLEQGEKNAREAMNRLVSETDWDGVEVESTLHVGHAGQQICGGADERGADLVVTSTHGTTGLKHILLGSTAEYVVRHARCPVLVVPAHERETPGLKA
jgi:nucleotide-binding universal stress UspA family protein